MLSNRKNSSILASTPPQPSPQLTVAIVRQDNMIEHVAGLEFLSHLQQLALANNPLTDFKELRRLSHLPQLTELSFKDLNFGVSALV